MKYKVIKAYTSNFYSYPIRLPVGTVVTYWDERGFYLSETVDGHCVPLPRYVVEAWNNYFEEIKDGQE